MTCHSDVGELGKIRWRDALLEEIAITYDAVSLRILQSDGSTHTLRAEGYIGFNLVGFWDESIIDRAVISEAHPGLDACVRSIRSRHRTDFSDSGNVDRNRGRWFALLVHLDDGCVLEIFPARIYVDGPSNSDVSAV